MKTVMIKEDIISRNNKRAKEVRDLTNEKNIFYINIMSSPGSGKTTLLSELIPALGNSFKIGVIEADIDSDKDAVAIEKATGAKTIQMHTGDQVIIKDIAAVFKDEDSEPDRAVSE